MIYTNWASIILNFCKDWYSMSIYYFSSSDIIDAHRANSGESLLWTPLIMMMIIIVVRLSYDCCVILVWVMQLYLLYTCFYNILYDFMLLHFLYSYDFVINLQFDNSEIWTCRNCKILWFHIHSINVSDLVEWSPVPPFASTGTLTFRRRVTQLPLEPLEVRLSLIIADHDGGIAVHFPSAPFSLCAHLLAHNPLLLIRNAWWADGRGHSTRLPLRAAEACILENVEAIQTSLNEHGPA